MICGLEIGLAIFGILALVRGKMTLSKNKIVVGAPARLLGLLALAPLPLAFGVGAVYAVTQVAAGGDPEKFAEDNRWTLTLIEGGIVIGVAIVVFAIGAMVAVSPAEAERRERGNRYAEDDYDDRDDRPRRDRDGRDDRDDDGRDDRDRKPWNR